MSVYDTTFVLNPQLEEAGLDQRIKEVVELIGANGGTMVKENRIGMRKLAYEIKKLTQGYYISLVYEGNGALVNELERRFRMDENCLRFLTCLYQEVTNIMESALMDRHDRGHGDHHRPHRRDRYDNHRRRDDDDFDRNDDDMEDDSDDE
ncbi:MAG: 30S ribosomal protein S6 [Candidatus Zixiibacteriota bacterium]